MALISLAACAGQAAEGIAKDVSVVDVSVPSACTTDQACPTGSVVVANAGVFDETAQQACTLERSSLEQILESYTLLEGHPPASENDLVPTYLREHSMMFDLSADGAWVPAPGSKCT
jgi:hypothetical protein